MRFDRERHFILIYRALLGFLIALVLVLILGTIIGLSRPSPPPSQQFFEAAPPPQSPHIFTGLGQIRASTRDPDPGTVIIFISFEYNPNDRAFSEELILRLRDLREIVLNYISGFSVAELQAISEESLRTEILRRFNAILRLGRIETLFFIDFMVIA